MDYEEDEIYSISTLLDPRFKEVCFTSSALIKAKRLLLYLMHKVSRRSADVALSDTSIISDNENVQEDAPVKKKKCLWASFDKKLKKKKANHQSTNEDKDEQEFSLYLSAEYIDRKEDPLTWWKGNRGQFPTLAKLAREYLAIPAMSTPSELIFSAARYIIATKGDLG